MERREFLISALRIAPLGIIISGCGYKPASRYSENILGHKVYVDVKIDSIEPDSGVFLKEEVMRTLRTRLDTQVVSTKEEADSIIIIPSYKFSYSPLNYDDNGYVIRYRVHTRITFDILTKKGKYHKVIKVDEDVGIKASSLTSSIARDTAIEYSIKKAMDKLVAFIAQKGYLD